ncbi:metal ABC transporter permease [Erysipelothrix aquatica]|uniref:metal ABC transporter permease n=1 Tax=Erysipelothrix aquatica TaxID=2683714 RepID=UPI001357BEC7|nr:metal ABC transporter permease [Erysipelothrix aquatica]
MFHDPFLVNAMIVGLLLGISAALMSPFLVFNNKSMIADGLSHVSFTAIILGYLFSNQPLLFSIPCVILVSFLLTLLIEKTAIEADASIAAVSALGLAIGLIIATVMPGFNRSIESLLVGSILTASADDLIVSGVIVMATVGVIYTYYWPLIATVFDATYAKSQGIHTFRMNALVNAMMAVFIVVGIRIVGTLLISSLVVFPALIASRLAHDAKRTLTVSVLASIIAIITGMIVSFRIGWPTGPTIIVVFALLFLIAMLYSKYKDYDIATNTSRL